MKLTHVCSMAAVTCLGCTEAPWQEDPDFEWHGEFVTIYGYDRDVEQACGESLRATNDEVRTLLEFHEAALCAPIRQSCSAQFAASTELLSCQRIKSKELGLGDALVI